MEKIESSILDNLYKVYEEISSGFKELKLDKAVDQSNVTQTLAALTKEQQLQIGLKLEGLRNQFGKFDILTELLISANHSLPSEIQTLYELRQKSKGGTIIPETDDQIQELKKQILKNG